MMNVKYEGAYVKRYTHLQKQELIHSYKISGSDKTLEAYIKLLMEHGRNPVDENTGQIVYVTAVPLEDSCEGMVLSTVGVKELKRRLKICVTRGW